MKVWANNKKNKIKKILLGNVPTPDQLETLLDKKIPTVIKKILLETLIDLNSIKKFLESYGITVLQYPIKTLKDTIHVRNGYLVCDDVCYISNKVGYLQKFYDSIDKKIVAPYGEYCPDILINDKYCILDGLEYDAYRFFRKELSKSRKVITAMNEGHSDGIYTNIADKVWLTNGNVLNWEKYFPNDNILDLSKLGINNWIDEKEFRKEKIELRKTSGVIFIKGHTMNETEINFIEKYLKHWVGYAEETLFDINLIVLDPNNVLVISQNSYVYDFLKEKGINVHQIDWRHRFFWDGGLHCITNEIERLPS